MPRLMDVRIAERVLRDCLGCREGETLLVVTDFPRERTARLFLEAGRALRLDASVVCMEPRRHPGEEPPEFVALALKQCHAAVLLTTQSLTHTRARREATEGNGVRAAIVTPVDGPRLGPLLEIDYDDLELRCERIARHLEGHREVRIRSVLGTDLRFEIGGRRIYRDCGRIRKAGEFGNLPAGEVCFAPKEGTAEGVLLVDGSVATLGEVMTPIRIRFEKGRAVEIGDPRLRELLEAQGPEAFQLAEFGIGTNPRARVVGNAAEDEKASGTVHVALGANASMEGSIQIPFHVDLILRRAEVEIDGTALPAEFLPSPPERANEARSTPVLDPVEIYRMLSEHSNDPQYLLDVSTQHFLQVNPAFERLTGYSRTELLSGSVTSGQIVARESMGAYHRKGETRREKKSERYDLKLLCKSGETKPVELSVTRLLLDGHDVVVGTIRDLTARKKLELEMWGKIEDLGHANNRIFALTEKIRRVPEFASALLHLTDLEDLLSKAGEILCDGAGFGYAAVSFYLAKESRLHLAYSTHRAATGRTHGEDDPQVLRIFRGEESPVFTDHEAILPLKGRERNLGILVAVFPPREIELLRGNERALKGYRDVLSSLANMLGLLVENLKLYERVRRQAIADPLTGVYNRRFFDSKLLDEFHRARRYGRDLAFLMIDMDRFREINNSLGHQQGDSLLVETASLLRSHTRDVDSLCRYGGDEFVILMPETPPEKALTKAEALRVSVDGHVFRNLREAESPIRLTLSIGVASVDSSVRDERELLRRVDDALFQAKRAGRNRVCGWKEERNP